MLDANRWVKDGHSVYENTCGAWADGMVPVEFLTVYRDEEYIRQHTKGMDSEETRKFALAYYGWDDDESHDDYIPIPDINPSDADELPFN